MFLDVSEYMTSGQRANFEAEEEAIKQESFSAFSIKKYLNTNKGEIYSVTGDDIKKQELHDMLATKESLGMELMQ